MKNNLWKRFRGKKLDDYTIEELEKKATMNKIIFWCYGFGSLGVISIGAYTLYPILNELMALNTDGSTKLLLILSLFGMINFFLLFFVWMTNESSYYKMEQEFNELAIYLRSKEFEE